MSLRGKLGMLTMMTMAMAVGMTGGGGGYRQPMPERNPEPPRPLGPGYLTTDIPKGHKSEVVVFTFKLHKYHLKITLVITGGSTKALQKKRIKTQNELGNYINRTDIGMIIKFGEFEVTEIPPTPALEKGDYQGICNRSACTTKLAAVYYNHSTQKHYCPVCANMINKVNPESYEMYGHELCTLVKPTNP